MEKPAVPNASDAVAPRYDLKCRLGPGYVRMLAPGGLLAMRDYSLAGPGAERLWTFMCRAVVRPFCAAVSGAPQLFDYLERSVLDFDRRDGLAARIRGAAFELLRVISGRLWQRQIVRTFLARRPA